MRCESLLTRAEKNLAVSLQKEASTAESEKMAQAQYLQIRREKESLVTQLRDSEQNLNQIINSRENERKLYTLIPSSFTATKVFLSASEINTQLKVIHFN